MTEPVTWHLEGRVGLIAIDNPPVNAASHAVRVGLVRAVDALEGVAEVIAIHGVGRSFVAGADIREFGQPPKAPWLPAVCARIEACTTPVVAVLHGAALGGGLEIAMAAHARVAVPGVKLGLPEVTLGILPGAGGTQRTPRLIGIARALEMIVSGRPIDAARALEIGLVDRVMDGAPPDIARQAASEILNGTLSPRVTGHLSVAPDAEALDTARADIARRLPHLFAPARCVEAVAAATTPLQEGLKTERALFDTCVESPQRAGLVHAFFAERAVSKIPEADALAAPVGKVGIVGGGTMGQGIAGACLIAGLDVIVVEPDADARNAAAGALDTLLQGAAKRGKLADIACARRNLRLATSLSELSARDVVIEAVPEDLSLKLRVFAEMDSVCRPDAILASNTSYLDLNEIAGAVSHPERVLGLHFFAPAHVMRLLEVVVADETAPATVATGFALAKRLRKVAVRAGVCDGFIGNRILSATRRAADEAVLRGASPAEVDAALETFGFAMGPYAAQDLSGLDVGAAGRAVRGEAAPVADALIARGDLGHKTGAGFYEHRGQKPVPNAALTEILAKARTDAGVKQNPPDAQEIIARYTTAMIREGCQVVEDGIALRAIDVDAVMLFGYGFPRHLGGPMHMADRTGLATVISRIERFGAGGAAHWTVPRILRDHAKRGANLIA
ncbi:3-hydroxyacyl-CoA dehydrogenase NAD-binding domain-containing protein [Tropicimonas sp. S265A]|uniref:3-hydroxyacyl-CoA dehydrogenase NAD-binding domain-containing protein n=1 Tax=Tropicimonas sp. S265A TaxID=3415134 RepID=UPI003C7A3567